MATKVVKLTISEDLLAWIEAQAEDMGCDAPTWFKMLATAARKQGGVHLAGPRLPGQAPRSVQVAEAPADDAWRGPVDEPALPAAVDALIEDRLADVTPTGPPTEMFERQPPGSVSRMGTVALSRPRNPLTAVASGAFPQRA